MPFDFFKKPKPGPKSEPFKQAVEDGLSPEELAYLEQIEQRLKSEAGLEERSAAEAEARRQEREQLEKSYQPQRPLYNANSPKPAAPTPERSSQQNSRQNDPRYREYFERLKRETVQSRPATNYDEEVKPTTLDELDRQGWKAKPQSQAGTSRTFSPSPSTPSRGAGSAPSSQSGYPSSPAADPTELHPGALVRLDDGSIAVYKDAVSGKDYALFYFLEPNGILAPRGIFLEQYEQQKIGQLPPTVLDQMIERKRWDRDAVIFHLDQYEFSSFIPSSQPRGSSSGRPATASGSGYGSSRPVTRGGENTTPTTQERRPATQSDVTDSWSGKTSSSAGPRRDALLERGRVLRINVGGRVWESVYWTEDEMGSIVAHNTNKVWALMHLDLNRFKDSLEYGDVLSYENLSEIEQSLASQQG